MEQALEPRQLAEIELTAERNPSIGQRFQVAQTVPGVQRAGHRPRIICEPVSDVKTVSYEASPKRSAHAADHPGLDFPLSPRAPGAARSAVHDARARTPPRTPSTARAPAAMAARLALAKARSIGDRGALVIGSDQVASLDGRLLRKPGSAEVAVAQLRACQGRTVLFHTAVAVIATDSGETLAARRPHRGAVPASRRLPRSSSTCGSRARSTAPAASKPKGSASCCSSRSRRRTRRR